MAALHIQHDATRATKTSCTRECEQHGRGGREWCLMVDVEQHVRRVFDAACRDGVSAAVRLNSNASQ
jgi:hypothetical protein